GSLVPPLVPLTSTFWATSSRFPWFQVRSPTGAPGTAVTGALPAQMSSPDTTASTLEPSPSSAWPADAASPAQTTWLCT
uniref:Uncharacterized protein n=1 Tax=Naja naja TaxID=35670 RepID=A0A8C6XSH7_NAJNA